MVDHTAVSLGSPSVSFFFARLGVFLEYSSGRRPHIGLFVSRECALRLVLLELYPLIHHSLIRYHLAKEMVEERLSELGMGLSSSNDHVGIEEDVTMSKPPTSSLSKPFQALIKECVLEWKHLKNLRKHFQFSVETKVCLHHPGERACTFSHSHVCFYEADFLCGLCFPIHPFIHELLNHFKIAFSQLNPNAWWMVMTVMSFWMFVLKGSMVSLNDFLYLYYLKPSTHYGYFEFYPWDRSSKVVCGLPSSFRGWKSKYFFVYGKGWEIASDEVWGELPPLPHTWEVPTLGASSLLLIFFII